MCREKGVVCKATVLCNNEAKNYFDLCETEFKLRYYNRVQCFKYHPKSNTTELSKYARDPAKMPAANLTLFEALFAT